jgi:hypothetical protein
MLSDSTKGGKVLRATISMTTLHHCVFSSGQKKCYCSVHTDRLLTGYSVHTRSALSEMNGKFILTSLHKHICRPAERSGCPYVRIELKNRWDVFAQNLISETFMKDCPHIPISILSWLSKGSWQWSVQNCVARCVLSCLKVTLHFSRDGSASVIRCKKGKGTELSWTP